MPYIKNNKTVHQLGLVGRMFTSNGRKIYSGSSDIESIITNGGLYVDKTRQVIDTIDSVSYFSLIRPRRFGKTLTLSTIKNLFLGRKDLFKGTFADKNWNFKEYYPVIHFDFASFELNDSSVRLFDNSYVFEGTEKIPVSDFIESYDSVKIGEIVKAVHSVFSKKPVVLIDEYDKPILRSIENAKDHTYWRNFFSNFYSDAKSVEPYLRFFLLSGLTRVLKMSLFSTLNNLVDSGLISRYDELVGYTEDEVVKNFDLPGVSKKYGITKKELLSFLRTNYAGFSFGGERKMFNTFDINNFFISGEYNNYWSYSGIPEYVLSYVNVNTSDAFEFLKKISTDSIDFSEKLLFVNDVSDLTPENVFYSSGYLTLQNPKSLNGKKKVVVTNGECQSVLDNLMGSIAFKSAKNNLPEFSEVANEFFDGVKERDSEKIRNSLQFLFDEYLTTVAYDWKTRKNRTEDILKTVVSFLIRLGGLNFYTEGETLLGRYDLVIQDGDDVIIIEAKINDKLTEASKQVSEKYEMIKKNSKKAYVMPLNWITKENVSKIELEIERIK